VLRGDVSTPHTLRALAGLAGVILALLIAAPAAAAENSARVTSLRCVERSAEPCPERSSAVAGGRLRVRGHDLRESRTVWFRGGPGPGDDASAGVADGGSTRFEVAVPIAANSGPVDVVGASGAVTAADRLRVTGPEGVPEDTHFAGDARRPSLTFAATSSGPVTVEVFSLEQRAVVRRLPVEAQAGSNAVTWDGRTADGVAPQGRYEMRLEGDAEGTTFELLAHVFPIRGAHDLGQTATNGFGGSRGHNGQDMFAACGTPVVAAREGRVREVGYNGAAGNHVVISSSVTGLDYVYMHLNARPLVREGDRVATRQPLGEVGQTGNAWGCHLHFELWKAPGWYAGGQVFDPLGRLRAWDASS
jgi:murein DD-endopeptidase MepM/ murein hydrolase activator NlpD